MIIYTSVVPYGITLSCLCPRRPNCLGNSPLRKPPTGITGTIAYVSATDQGHSSIQPVVSRLTPSGRSLRLGVPIADDNRDWIGACARQRLYSNHEESFVAV